jgi:hypothetical protein
MIASVRRHINGILDTIYLIANSQKETLARCIKACGFNYKVHPATHFGLTTPARPPIRTAWPKGGNPVPMFAAL